MLGSKGKQILKPKIQKIIPKKNTTGTGDGQAKDLPSKDDAKEASSSKKGKGSKKPAEKELKSRIIQD